MAAAKGRVEVGWGLAAAAKVRAEAGWGLEEVVRAALAGGCTNKRGGR